MSEFRTWEDYLWPGSDVLRNKLGIHDRDALLAAERDLTAGRLAQLRQQPIEGDFDLAHLQAIHRHLFGDVYEWAGELRLVGMSKGDTMFCRPEFLTSYAGEVFGPLRAGDSVRGLSLDQFLDRAADLLADINALHPFREGNGRAQRAFLDAVADSAGYRLVWPQDALAGERNTAASIAAMRGDNSALRGIIAEAIQGHTPPAAPQSVSRSVPQDRGAARRP